MDVENIVWLVIGVLYGIYWIIKKANESNEQKRKQNLRAELGSEPHTPAPQRELTEEEAMQVFFKNIGMIQQQQPEPAPQPQQQIPVLQEETKKGRLLAGEEKLPEQMSTMKAGLQAQTQAYNAVTESETETSVSQGLGKAPKPRMKEVQKLREVSHDSETKRRATSHAEMEQRLAFPHLTPLQRAIVLSEIMPRRGSHFGSASPNTLPPR